MELSHHSSTAQKLKPNNPRPSTVTLRMLCHVLAAGGVIGQGGSVVRGLEGRIGVRINFSGPILGCVERIVTVTGSGVLIRQVRLCTGKDVEEEVFDVSPVQEALLRVFERAFQVEVENYGNGESAASGGDSANCCCRLLADQKQCAILIGKGGKRVAQICRECRANIRVLRSEQNPACASPADKIIHITGGVLSVKRALLAVSRVLQDLPQMENESALMNFSTKMNVPLVTVPRQELPDPHIEFFPDLCVPVPGSSGRITTRQVATVNFSHSVHEGDEPCNVIFRMICSNYEAGAVIGKGATFVRLLQNESGAFIQFAPGVDGVEHRIVTISAKECLSSSYSPAQNAVIRIAARLAEVAAKDLCRPKVDTVTIRLVITSGQANSFRNKESVHPGIRDVEIQISDADLGQSTLTKDEILQVGGGSEKIFRMEVRGQYIAVQRTLLQVTKVLRESCFPSSALKETGERNHLSCVIPGIDSYGRMTNANEPPFRKSLQPFPNFNQESMMWGMQHLRISKQPKKHLPGQKSMGRGNHPCDDPESTKNGDTKVTMKVHVPEHAYDSVFGENGSNIDRIQQISGADVQVHDPPEGQKHCTAIVSGERAQVLAASSLHPGCILRCVQLFHSLYIPTL